MAKVGPEITNQFEPCRAQHTQTDDDNKLPVQGSAVVTFFFDTLIFGKQNWYSRLWGRDWCERLAYFQLVHVKQLVSMTVHILLD